jgi:ribosomal protein S6--L-glutamate ligase
VGNDSGLAGKSLQESKLRERDVLVLSLSRDGKIIPNPRGTRVVEVGDRLLCFGKTENMSDLLPAEIQRRRRRKVSKRVQE